MEKNLGHATAYGYAKSKGYSGTEEEFAELMADYASVGQSAVQSAEQAAASATSASGSAATASQAAQTATSKASEAVTAAETATTKASEASQSASTASSAATSAGTSAQTATTAATTATTKASEASESATTASTAKTDAEAARDAAAQSASEAAASAESIDPEEFDRKIYAAFATDTATGAVASFTDGADNIPMKDVVVHIEPAQEGSGDPSPDNIRPITGWTGCEVRHSGVNIFNKATAVQNCFINNDDGLENQSTGSVATDYIPVKPRASYRVATEQSRGMWGAWYDKGKNYISSITGYNNALMVPDNARYMRLTAVWVSSGVRYGNLDTFSINYSSTDTDYHPYSGNSLSISLPQTVYGGTLDVVSGELVVDRAMVDLGSLNWSRTTSYTNPVFAAKLENKKNPNQLLCSIFEFAGNFLGVNTFLNASGNSTLGNCSENKQIYVREDSCGSVPAFVDFVRNQHIVYELATPITITLTPTEIKSLLGDNNLWADTGDTEVEYRADTKLYIEKLTQPEEDDMIADSVISEGQFFMIGNSLYRALANIASGATITVGTNAQRVSLSDALNLVNA